MRFIQYRVVERRAVDGAVEGNAHCGAVVECEGAVAVVGVVGECVAWENVC